MSNINQNIKLYAGEQALAELREQGLSPQRIRMMIGASGGPKWLMLSRLDQYLSEHFLPAASQPIQLLGSSIGAWRMSCYAMRDPLASFRQFEDLYLDQTYAKKITADQVTVYANTVLETLLGEQGAQYIASNAQRNLHVVAVRNRKVFNSRHPFMQGLSLLSAATANLVSARAVSALYPRVVISPNGSTQPYFGEHQSIHLTAENLKDALLASGAIPLVLEPTKVSGGLDRWHWDGGMVDYHFSGPFNVDDGLVFYPHFFPRIVPGWFDKGLPWRKLKPQNYRNVVVLCPSHSFIEKLPFGKIPDRNDFNRLSNESRTQYWRTVLSATDTLVDEFHELLTKDMGRSAVEPIDRMLRA